MSQLTLDLRHDVSGCPSPVAIDLLDRSRRELARGVHAQRAGDRYVHAHLSALRAAAAVVAVRSRPSTSRRRRPLSVWSLLESVAPELTEWAAFFARGAATRAAIEAGRDEIVTVRQADDLVREAEAFHRDVESVLGLAPAHPITEALPACTA